MEPTVISDTELKTTIIGFVGLGHMGGNMAARFLTGCKCPTKSSAGLLVSVSRLRERGEPADGKPRATAATRTAARPAPYFPSANSLQSLPLAQF